MGSGYKDFAPGDVLAAADVDGYLMRQTMMTFADAATRDTALSGVLDEGMIAYLEDDNLVTVYNGTDWKVINSTEQTYGLVSYTVTGTFVKADYPWARSVKVRVVGGGGGGGGSDAPGVTDISIGAGGGGGGYSERWMQISALAASETVTVGTGGAGGVAGAPGVGGTGVTSSFGAFVSASGGIGGSEVGPNIPATTYGIGGKGGVGSSGDVNANGSPGFAGLPIVDTVGRVIGGYGGASVLGAGGRGPYTSSTISGDPGELYGGGGSGACSDAGETAQTGGAGADGIVIVEMYG